MLVLDGLMNENIELEAVYGETRKFAGRVRGGYYDKNLFLLVELPEMGHELRSFETTKYVIKVKKTL